MPNLYRCGGKNVSFGTLSFSGLGNSGGTVDLSGIEGYEDITNLYVINTVSCGLVKVVGGTQSGDLVGGYVASYTAGGASATVACFITRIDGHTTFSGTLLWIKDK